MNNIVLGKEIKKSRLVIYSREENRSGGLVTPHPQAQALLPQTLSLSFLLF